MAMWVYLNDRFVKRDEAKVSVFDHGFLYGDGVYETLRSYKGKLLFLDRHLASLRQSCHLIGMDMPISENRWPSILLESLERNELANRTLRITISRSEGEPGLDPSLCGSPTLVVLAKAFVPYPSSMKEQGVRLVLATIRQNPPAAQPPTLSH